MNSFRSCRRFAAGAAVVLAMGACGANDPARFMTSAQKYLAQKNYPAAIIELKNALAAAPGNAQARFLLGNALLDVGDPVGAATELRKAIVAGYSPDEGYPALARAVAQRPATPAEIAELVHAPVQGTHAKAQVAALLASSYLALGDFKETRTQLDAALALEPANVDARVTLAKLYAVQKDVARAEQEVSGVLAQLPDQVDALMVKAEVALAAGKSVDATRTLERVVAIEPEALRARFMLATVYVQGKVVDKAAEQVDFLRKAAPDDVHTLHAVALLAFAKDDMRTALEAVQKALEIAPDYLPARYLSGLIDLKRGAYASAEQSLRQVARQLPDDDGASLALAQVLLRRSQPGQARATLAPLLERSPDSVGALRLAAEVEMMQSAPAKAASYIARANALDLSNVEGQVRLAQVKMAQGDTREAMRELETLSAGNSGVRDADLTLIGSHLRMREYSQALAAADALIRKEPKNPIGQNAKGAVFMAMNDPAAARRAFDQALALDPGFEASQYALAQLDVAERSFASARTRYQKMLDKHPQLEPALLGAADALEASGAPPADIVAALERAVATNPNSVQSRVALVNYYARQKNWKAALTAAQAAQAAIPDAPQVLAVLGTAQQAGGEANQAIETYARWSRLMPQNAAPLLRLAAVQASQKNYDAALAALDRAHEVAPDNPSLWIAQASVYHDAGRTAAGLDAARRLEKASPKSPAGYALEGELYALDRQYDPAVTVYRAALAQNAPASTVMRLHAALVALGKEGEADRSAQQWIAEHPDDVLVRASLGQRELDKGDCRAATPYFREAVEHDPANSTLLNNLAWCLAESKEPSALAFAERAYRIAPGSAAVANTYGWILVQRGETAEGIRELRRATDLDPGDAARRLYLAKALLANGDKGEARKELEIVARTDTGTGKSEAKQLLEGI